LRVGFFSCSAFGVWFRFFFLFFGFFRLFFGFFLLSSGYVGGRLLWLLVFLLFVVEDVVGRQRGGRIRFGRLEIPDRPGRCVYRPGRAT
jgi:hypothetical protein